MSARKARKERPPLTPDTLGELALNYVGRFATTRAKLVTYLRRKVGERGWGDIHGPDLEAIASSFAERGYIDDKAYAMSKSRALTSRGYGLRRVEQALRSAGVEEADASGARDLASEEAVEAALRFAQRRRIGPFAAMRPDPKARERGLAAMVRAGHSFGIARALIDLEPGTEIDREQLRGMFG